MNKYYLLLIPVILIILFLYTNNLFNQTLPVEELITFFDGFYEIDAEFKHLSESENSSIILRNDKCEFIREEGDSINISLDYKNIKFDEKKINIIATVHSYTSEDIVEYNPIINSDLILVLNLKNGTLQISDLNRQTILGIYTKDNIISNLSI